MTIEPPGDATSQNFFYATNDVGTKSCQADIIASNTPPFPTAFYGTGTEDDASITGTLQAVDFNSGDTVTFSKLGDPLNGMLIVQTNGDIDYTPNPNFCGVDTFQFIARDNNNNSSDPTDAQITVLCQNDAPVAIDDMYTLSGNTTSIIDPKVNDVDVDMPFTPQTFSLS